MKPRTPNAISQSASMTGKKGGRRTLERYGPEHFSKASCPVSGKSGLRKARHRRLEPSTGSCRNRRAMRLVRFALTHFPGRAYTRQTIEEGRKCVL